MTAITGLRGGGGLSEEQAGQQWREWAVSRRRLLRTAGFGAGALALAGLSRPGSVNSAQSTPAAAMGEPVMGGSLSMSLADDDVLSFDPVPVFDNMSIWTMLLIYDQLIRVGPDGTSLEPGLATEWSASEDGLTYTFTLRETTFHDGTPCTAEDAAFCLNRVAFEEGSPWAFIFSAVESVEAPAVDSVVVRLNSVWVPFEADMALFGASVYPRAAFEAQGDELWQAPIGTGPFTFESWDKGAQIVLRKNPAYWDQPKSYLDEVVFKVLTDANARMLQFQGGELDIIGVVFNQ